MSFFFPFGFYSPKHSNRCYVSSYETCSVFCSTSVLPAWAFSLQTPGAFSVSPSVLSQTRRFGWSRRTPVVLLSLSHRDTHTHTHGDTSTTCRREVGGAHRKWSHDQYYVRGISPPSALPVPGALRRRPSPSARAPCRVGGVVAGRRKRVRTSSRQSPPRNSLRRWSRHCPSG